MSNGRGKGHRNGRAGKRTGGGIAAFWRWCRHRPILVVAVALAVLVCIATAALVIARKGEDPCVVANRMAYGPVQNPYPGGIVQFTKDLKAAASACEDKIANQQGG